MSTFTRLGVTLFACLGLTATLTVGGDNWSTVSAEEAKTIRGTLLGCAAQGSCGQTNCDSRCHDQGDGNATCTKNTTRAYTLDVTKNTSQETESFCSTEVCTYLTLGPQSCTTPP